jgi:hypothetical protein
MIGSPITSWEGAGAYYAGSGSEGIWLLAAIVLCVGALVFGARHEQGAYAKLK